MRILIVEVDERHGQRLVDLLAGRGHDALLAQSEGEAEWLSSLFRFDLLVIDLDIPGSRGLEAARRLLLLSPGLEVVGFSAHSRPDSGSEGTGEIQVFRKPIDEPALLAFIEGISHRRSGAPLMRRTEYPLQPYGK